MMLKSNKNQQKRHLNGPADFLRSLLCIAPDMSCLGHSNTNISRHYAKLFSSTVFDAFKEIGEGL